MSDFKLREARGDDIQGILELWRLVGSGPSVTDTVEHLQMLAKESAGLFLVAEGERRIIGTIIGGWDNWRGHIYRLAVHPSHRRRGIAKALVGEIERRLGARGARRIHAIASTANGLAFWNNTSYEHTDDHVFIRNIGASENGPR